MVPGQPVQKSSEGPILTEKARYGNMQVSSHLPEEI
jgi:hypothetical protein